MPTLVVITGPIGAGKSTVAHGLADRYKAVGLSAAVVDVDDVMEALYAPLERYDKSREQLRGVHGALTAAWIRAGVDAVIVHGPFHAAAETSTVMREVPDDVVARRVMLLVPYDVALDRVHDDSARGISKDPSFLRSTHDRFARLLPDIPPCEWVFDTTTTAVADIVSRLAHDLIAPTSQE